MRRKNALIGLTAFGTLLAAAVGSMWLGRDEVPPEGWQAVVSRVEADQVCIDSIDDQYATCLPPQQFWPGVNVGDCASATWKAEAMFPTVEQIDCPA